MDIVDIEKDEWGIQISIGQDKPPLDVPSEDVLFAIGDAIENYRKRYKPGLPKEIE